MGAVAVRTASGNRHAAKLDFGAEAESRAMGRQIEKTLGGESDDPKLRAAEFGEEGATHSGATAEAARASQRYLHKEDQRLAEDS